MGWYTRLWTWIVLLLLTLSADVARGQWAVVAPGAIRWPVPPGFHGGGAIHYKDGIVWAGGYNLVFSSDSGNTWNTTNFTISAKSFFDGIIDISFLDKNTGVVATESSGLFITHDQGQTWSLILAKYCSRVAFSRNSVTIYAVDEFGDFLISSDEGLSWNQTNLVESASFVETIDRTIYATCYTAQPPGIGTGYLDISRDSGTTWTSESPAFDADCFSIDIDSCDASRAYIANENYRWQGDSTSKIYSTTDAGLTWDVSFSHPTHYLAGSFANSGNALYAGTVVDGILRSTDKGNSWINIGGPISTGDCRQIATISDNIILALDSEGNIWSTFNSGGDSIFSTSPTSLILSTEDVKTDTLGATVAVPIIINGLTHPEDVDLILHYDGTVDYLGSFSPLGAKLDIPGEQWKGRSELSIPDATPGVVAGYAKFNVFNDSNEDAHATFDSVDVPMLSMTCQYSMPEAVTSTITPPSGCGITILSQFIHLGELPRFIVYPNPASNSAWISSTADLGDVTFTIYDMLGTERSEIVASVSKDIPAELTLPQADGVYNIVAKYSSGKSMMRVVREHY